MAGRVFPMVTDWGPEPPFVVNDHGDLHVVESLQNPSVEIYDASDFEYFDAQGKKLAPTVAGRRVSLHLDMDARPEPERLLALIHAYAEAVIRRGDFREVDRSLVEAIQQAPTLRESIIALGHFIDANQSHGLLSRLARRKHS